MESDLPLEIAERQDAACDEHGEYKKLSAISANPPLALEWLYLLGISCQAKRKNNLKPLLNAAKLNAQKASLLAQLPKARKPRQWLLLFWIHRNFKAFTQPC
ncbi:MAG TPA: hypothetical protein VFP71_05805 [Candidatus Angelobacter sp.]|nr:hypothetical protein [Candidatus Angelobacter sp.]